MNNINRYPFDGVSIDGGWFAIIPIWDGAGSIENSIDNLYTERKLEFFLQEIIR